MCCYIIQYLSGGDIRFLVVGIIRVDSRCIIWARFSPAWSRRPFRLREMFQCTETRVIPEMFYHASFLPYLTWTRFFFIFRHPCVKQLLKNLIDEFIIVVIINWVQSPAWKIYSSLFRLSMYILVRGVVDLLIIKRRPAVEQGAHIRVSLLTSRLRTPACKISLEAFLKSTKMDRFILHGLAIMCNNNFFFRKELYS